MKVLSFSGSLRKDSLNKKNCLHAQMILKEKGLAEVEVIDLTSLEIPLFNEDLEKASGLPKGVEVLCQKIAAADALVISTPEFNGSISGALKNAIDWVSRVKPLPWSAKHILLMAASPGYYGGMRGLWHTRVPLEALCAFVYPEMHSLPKAHEAFDADGRLRDPAARAAVEGLLTRFIVNAGQTPR
jgi:NAD(P)H-dependent FMN reductase